MSVSYFYVNVTKSLTDTTEGGGGEHGFGGKKCIIKAGEIHGGRSLWQNLLTLQQIGRQVPGAGSQGQAITFKGESSLNYLCQPGPAS